MVIDHSLSFSRSFNVRLNDCLFTTTLYEGNLLCASQSVPLGKVTVTATQEMIEYYGTNGVIPSQTMRFLTTCCMRSDLTLEFSLYVLEKSESSMNFKLKVDSTISLAASASDDTSKLIRAAVDRNDFHR